MEKLAHITKYIINITFKVLNIILIIVSTLGLVIVPFLQNVLDFKIANWLWYPSCIISFALTIIDVFVYKEPTFKTPVFEFLGKWGFFSCFPFFASVFVFNYYDIDYIWLWVIFGVAFIYFPVFFFGLFNSVIKQDNPDEQYKQRAAKNIIKYILLFWIYDLFYMSIFNKWMILTFIFGTVAVIIMLYNLTQVFLLGDKSIKFLLPFDLAFGVGLSIYLIYIIPNSTLQTIVLTITAAIFGGILTLVGVAWTIKDGQRQQFETKRLEKIPYLQVDFGEWENSNNILDMLWTITRCPNDEECVPFSANVKVVNIGLGLATNVTCQWISDGITTDLTFPVSILKCEQLYKFNVSGFARVPDKEVDLIRGTLVIKFKDLLGNNYKQEIDILFEITANSNKIATYDVFEPEYVLD